jgi:truncated hemoglobin YjbI
MAFRGRIGAYRLHATHDPREITQKARDAFLHRFEEEIDPDHTLPEEERNRRAAYARRAYFARLALASARTRRLRSARRTRRSRVGTFDSSAGKGDSGRLAA